MVLLVLDQALMQRTKIILCLMFLNMFKSRITDGVGEISRHLVVLVTPYSTSNFMFGAQESKWKPLQVVEHIKLMCTLMCTNGSITESRELRKPGSKSNPKKEETCNSVDDDNATLKTAMRKRK